MDTKSHSISGLAITVLAEVTDVGGNDAEVWALSAQNFLICLEMLLFSIAHFYCFPTEEWEEGYRANFNKSKFGDSIALGDFLSDIKLIMKGNTLKKKLKKEPSEPTVLEEDEESGRATIRSKSDLDDNEEEQEHARAVEDNNSETSETSGSLTLSTGISSSQADSREIEEARNRLLQSGLLNEMLFLEPRYTPMGAETSSREDEGTSHWSTTGSPSTYGATDSKTPTERTGLLASSTTAASTPLRPSIFTTIAALSMHEDDVATTDTPKKESSASP